MEKKWKKKIWVIDDIVPKAHQEKIKDMMLGDGTHGSTFPWHFMPDVTGGGSKDKRPTMAHTFIRDGEIKTNPQYIQTLEPMWMACLERLMTETKTQGNYTPLASRSFLQMPLNTMKGNPADSHHIDRSEEHFALLYYVIDADGDTLLYENMYSPENTKPPAPKELKIKKRVKPKQGRVVIFDGYYWHTATQPRNGIRCIINTDVLQKDD